MMLDLRLSPRHVRLSGWAILSSLVILSLAELTAAQQAPQEPEPIPALDRAHVPRTKVDKVIMHVETGRDGWLSERYDEEIHKPLNALKKLLAGKPLNQKKLRAILAPTFRGSAFLSGKATWLRRKAPLVVHREGMTELTVTAQTAPRELERWLADYAEVAHVELKTIGIKVEPGEPPAARIRVRYDVKGRTANGELLQRTGTWDTAWSKHPQQGWQWTEAVAGESWEARTPRLHFTDITTCALPQEVLAGQLQRGIDWWAAHLDVASAIDIYGNNGVAVADVDADGQEDFYLCQPAGLPNRFFHSKGDGTFEDISRQAGVDALDRSAGALFFDYDNDGDPDLLLVGAGLLLFRNDGDLRFTFQDPARIGLTPAEDKKTTFTSACVADYDRDGWLDIYVCSYIWKVGESGYLFPNPYHDATNGSPNFLFRNNGDGTFRDVTHAVGLDQNNTRFSFACAWADYAGNGFPDLYVANDFGRN
ncbi:MAG: FG-GAP repeat domain-containing protein, partial [Terriglobia bacterium]